MNAVPSIVDYNLVLARLESEGLVCNYYNGGAFGFPKGTPTHTLAFVGLPDDTIRPAARPFTRQVPEPHETRLAALATRFWQQNLNVPVWVMPTSHWAFELDFGNRDWLPNLLQAVGLPHEPLQNLNNAAALEFTPDEQPAFRLFLQGLLTHLQGSDFLLAFPGRPVVCMVHHHQQLWFTTSDLDLVDRLEAAIGE